MESFTYLVEIAARRCGTIQQEILLIFPLMEATLLQGDQ